MGLIQGGLERLGEVVSFTNLSGPPVQARIVDPVFYDKEGAKPNV